MHADKAVDAFRRCHHFRDHERRCIAGKNRRGFDDLVDGCVSFALELEIFSDGLDDDVAISEVFKLRGAF